MESTHSLKEPSVYVSSYAFYNNGSLDGPGWVDLWDFDSKEDFIRYCIDYMKDLGDRDPELMFQDHEYVPKSLIGESYISDMLWEINEEDNPQDVLDIVLDYDKAIGIGKNTSLYDIIENVVHTGRWKDFVYEAADDFIANASKESIADFFDYEMFEKNLQHDYYVGDNHVFLA